MHCVLEIWKEHIPPLLSPSLPHGRNCINPGIAVTWATQLIELLVRCWENIDRHIMFLVCSLLSNICRGDNNQTGQFEEEERVLMFKCSFTLFLYAFRL